MREWVILLLSMVLLACGCQGSSKPGLTDAELERIATAQKIELVEAEGEHVLKVGDETVTSDEIIESRVENYGTVVPLTDALKPIAKITELEQFKKRAGKQLEEIVAAKVSNILLYQHARKQAGTNVDEALDKAADSELRKFTLNFGGDQAKADEALKRGQMDRKRYKELQKRAILIQWYITSKLPNNRPVTYRELVECYNQMKDESFAKAATITFQLIDIEPAQLDVEDPNQDPLDQATRLANELIKQAQEGKNFGELAGFADAHRGVTFVAYSKPVQAENLIYDELAREAEKMKPGDVTPTPVQTADGEHVFVMRLDEKQSASYEPFEEVQEQVLERLLFNRRNEVLDRLNAKLMQDVEFSRTSEFTDLCLEKIYRISNQ